MPSILKREFAPISDAAWKEIDRQAAESIANTLTGRRIADFKGPYGWEFGAVNVGRLDVRGKDKSDVYWGVRKVQLVIEIREPFMLRQMELDDFARGAADVDLHPLIETARRAARFEDRVVYHGFEPLGIRGITQSAEQSAAALPKEGGEYPGAVSRAIGILTAAGIQGPYKLVLGPESYFTLRGSHQGCPPYRIIQDMLAGGEILMSEAINGGVLVSTRGGDFELSVGKDFSVGYASHTRDEIEFFVTETFSFRVLEPKAAVVFKIK